MQVFATCWEEPWIAGDQSVRREGLAGPWGTGRSVGVVVVREGSQGKGMGE